MSKKGVSAEEKRTRLLQLFYEKGECFQLKELEKIAPKEKGIVAGSVKEVLQNLVENGLVDTDKIGTSIYYWAFPSKAFTLRKNQMQKLKQNTEETINKLKAMEDALQAVKNTNDDNSYANILEELNDKEMELSALKNQLKHYEENDPVKFKEMLDKTEELKNAANRWTDNVFAVKSWCKKKFLMEDAVLNKQFGISDEFDYVD
ncbi:unnamed protein product [Phyllotreta striolata]|uniref:Meiotic nuclear division protein 1 homolog n=1 Tax=Phyllotreta striolata TaxID=444603 RepID=A0A9N9TZJ7_PHYSR|nr:unnamed protein product [Phyllotreta striolata]